MKVLVKILLAFVKTISLIIILAFGVSFISPFYEFPESRPFAGNEIYNPYKNMDENSWLKGNFQVQSNAWGGVTNGRKNTDSLIYHRYKELGFDIISISDYQKINQYNSYSEDYIPVYEHGFGIFKNHQVCLGSKKVEWLDFPIYHTIHHKQFIINRLRKHNELVAIAHPKLWGAYSEEDMTKLANYDLIEVLNNYRISDAHWDAALSSGKPVFLLANDDAHNVHNIREVGRRFTVLNTPVLRQRNILHSLKHGISYGVDMENSDSLWTEKAQKMQRIPQLVSVKVKNDTIFYEVSQEATQFRFIGQNGLVKKTDAKKAFSYYVMQPDDTYIRAEIEFSDLATLYLNPVFKYDGDNPIKLSTAYIDIQKTNIFRITLFAILFIMAGYRLYLTSRSKPEDEGWLPSPI